MDASIKNEIEFGNPCNGCLSISPRICCIVGIVATAAAASAALYFLVGLLLLFCAIHTAPVKDLLSNVDGFLCAVSTFRLLLHFLQLPHHHTSAANNTVFQKCDSMHAATASHSHSTVRLLRLVLSAYWHLLGPMDLLLLSSRMMALWVVPLASRLIVPCIAANLSISTYLERSFGADLIASYEIRHMRTYFKLRGQLIGSWDTGICQASQQPNNFQFCCAFAPSSC